MWLILVRRQATSYGRGWSTASRGFDTWCLQTIERERTRIGVCGLEAVRPVFDKWSLEPFSMRPSLPASYGCSFSGNDCLNQIIRSNGFAAVCRSGK
jgi:hypothetical protein